MAKREGVPAVGLESGVGREVTRRAERPSDLVIAARREVFVLGVRGYEER